MSEAEKSLQDFLQRWSQRKRGLEERPSKAPRAMAESNEAGAPDPKSDTPVASPDSGVEPFDLARLPPIETIDSSTDIRAFLAPGVPAELTRAALRRTWLSDPAIRDFVGLAENQWDFTNLDTVPGFGSFELTPELRSLVAGLWYESSTKHADAADTGAGRNAPAPATPETLASDRATAAVPDSVSVTGADATPSPVTCPDDAAMQNDPVDEEQPRPQKPKHGGALPR